MENAESTRPADAEAPAAKTPVPQNMSALPADVRQALQLPTSPDSPESLARERLAAKTAERVKQIEQLDLGLPEFRESTPQESQQADRLLRDANIARKRENYREAEAKCKEALKLIPKEASALEFLGDLYQDLAKVDEAMAAYKRATLADPRRATAERKYADLLMRQEHWEIVGADIEAAPQKRWMAPTLSLLLPGAGQAVNGQWVKGLIVLALAVLCIFGYTSQNTSDTSSTGTSSAASTRQSKTSKRVPMNTGAMFSLVAFGIVYIYSVADAKAVADRGSSGKRTGGSGWEV